MRKHIGNVIHSQMTFGANRMIVWSWGANAYRLLPESPDFQLGGLQFRVKGAKFAGHIRVTLNGRDLYDVVLGKLHKGKMRVIKQYDDLYAEDLVNAIDGYVET